MSHDRERPCPPLAPAVKVLIVEDELMLATSLEEILAFLGYTVTGIATSFVETLCHVEQDCPDVVLMDIWLHGIQDGIETGIFLWNVFQLPVIYLTRYSDQSTLERAYASLPFGYLVKPVKVTELAMAINLAYHCCQTKQP